MLYLTRKIGESVVINDEIEVTVVDIRGKSIKLGFTFPAEATVLRREIYDRIQSENQAAASASEAFAAVFTPDSENKSPSIKKSPEPLAQPPQPREPLRPAKHSTPASQPKADKDPVESDPTSSATS